MIDPILTAPSTTPLTNIWCVFVPVSVCVCGCVASCSWESLSITTVDHLKSWYFAFVVLAFHTHTFTDVRAHVPVEKERREKKYKEGEIRSQPY